MISRATRDPEAWTWTFFERHDEPDLWCAVPATASMPRFLFSGAWRFTAQGPVHAVSPAGFKLSAALESDGLNGFYLFHRVSERSVNPYPTSW